MLSYIPACYAFYYCLATWTLKPWTKLSWNHSLTGLNVPWSQLICQHISEPEQDECEGSAGSYSQHWHPRAPERCRGGSGCSDSLAWLQVAHTEWAALLKGVDKTCQILTEPVNMTNPVVWKKWSGQNLASKSNPNTRTDSSNYNIYRSAQAHSTKSILTSPVLQNPTFSYFQSAVGLKNCKPLEVTDLNPCQNNNRKTGKHHTGFMREKIKWHFYMQMMNITEKEFNMMNVMFPLCY